MIEVDLQLSGYRPNADDVLIIGGGGLWGPCATGCLADALYDRWLAVPARLVLANLGIESFVPASSEQVANLCRKAAIFSFRDAWSWSVASAAVSEQTVFWAADTTYLSPIQMKRSQVERCIGVNVCGPEVGNYTNNYSMDAVVAALLHLSTIGYHLKATVLSYGGLQPDHAHCLRVDAQCPRRFTLAPYRDCEVFIGMRFHSVLLALQNNIPVVAINYSHKVRRVMEEYGLERYCLEPTDPALQEKLVRLVKTVRNQEVRDKIGEGNSRARQRLVRFTEELHRVISGSDT